MKEQTCTILHTNAQCKYHTFLVINLAGNDALDQVLFTTFVIMAVLSIRISMWCIQMMM